MTWLFSLSLVVVSLVLVYVNNFNDKIGYCEKPIIKLRACLNPLSFYKNWFLALAHKNWFLKKLGGVFGDQFLKAENQFLETEMTYVPLI
jgi:uncharacterized membrane protein